MPAPSSRSSAQRALRARDAGLRRISLTTRALVVGSVAAAGAFSSLAAWAQPGRSKAAATTNPGVGGQVRVGTGTTPATTPATTEAPSGEGGGDDLAPPAAAPATVPAPAYQYTPPTPQYTPPTPQYSPPVVVSGAS